jgi:hypothetical protein
MRKGWFHESARHSLAARGIPSTYLKRKKRGTIVRSSVRGIAPPNLVAKRRDLIAQAREHHETAKKAQAFKAKATKKQRAQLEKIREFHARKRIELNAQRKVLNKEINELRREGALSPEERLSNLELDQELREQRIQKFVEIESAVQESPLPRKKTLPGTPTKAKITVAPGRKKIVSQEARKKEVIISGEQGRASGALEAEERGFLINPKTQEKVRIETDTDLPDLTVNFEGIREVEKAEDAPGIEVKQKPSKKSNIKVMPAEGEMSEKRTLEDLV